MPKTQGKLCEHQTVTLPPIRIRVEDKDISSFFGSTSYNVLGQAIVNGTCLDATALPTANGWGLDINKSHKAYWHALDKDEKLEFESYTNPAWTVRPRLLMAAGFSCISDSTSETLQMITTERSLKCNIDFDLLGVRGIDPSKYAGIQLHLTPFWTSGSISVDLDEQCNCQGKEDSPETENFKNNMDPLVA